MLQKLLSGPGRLITHFLVWLLIAVVMYYLLSTIRPPAEAAGRTFINLVFPFTIFYVNGRVLVNRFFETGKYWKWACWSVVMWLGMAVLRVKTEVALFGGSIFTDGRPPEDGGWRIFLAVALIFFILMVFSGLYQLLENRRELETLHAEAQINYLKAQINPHFLFNTLNNIYSAAVLQHPRTPDMVLRLSNFLRYVTYDAQSDKVALKKEVEHIRSYIELFQLKAETPLPIRFEVKGQMEECDIEPLLLLPLVENALKHGDLENNPDGYVNIVMEVKPGRLNFEIENTYNPADRQKDRVGGVGLKNITRRLELNYPQRHTFDIIDQGKVYKVLLSLEKQ